MLGFGFKLLSDPDRVNLALFGTLNSDQSPRPNPSGITLGLAPSLFLGTFL